MTIEAGWPQVKVGDLITDLQPGFACGAHNSNGTGVPHLRPMNVSTEGRIDRSVLKFVALEFATRPEQRLRRGDVVFNNTNSPELVGKTALFADDDEPAFSNHMTRLRPDPTRVDPEFLALMLHQAWRSGWFAEHCNNHVSQASIGRGVLEALEISLPPLEIQRSIGALNARVSGSQRAAVRHLSSARLAIDRFRRSLLAAACSGRLTEDWRQTNPRAESIDMTLAAVRMHSRRRGPNHQAVDLELPEFPESYRVHTIDEISTVLEYGTSKRADSSGETGTPILRMGNIQAGELDLSELKFIDRDAEIDGLMLKDGDLLFNRTNSPELVGKSAIFHSTQPMTFASYLIRVTFAPDIAEPDFVNLWINSAWGKEWARLAKTDGVSQSNINGSKLGGLPVPLPPVAEQREIVKRALNLLGAANETSRLIAQAVATSKRLETAITQKAFRAQSGATQ
jgi:type I restriction enzyme S subunit